MDNNKINAKINARNKANEVANRVYEELIPVFRPLMGKKVCKVDGTFLKKVANQLPNWEKKHALITYPWTIHHSSSDYYVMFNVSVSEPVTGWGHLYEDASVYICRINEGKEVIEICDPPNRRSDYSFDEIKSLIEDYEQKREAANEARSALHPFGDLV